MPELPWYAYALLGALFVSFASVVEKKALQHDEPLHFSAGSSLVLGLLSVPFLFVIDWSAIPALAYAYIFVISVGAMIAFYLVAYSLRRLEAGENSLILALTPAATAVAALLFLGEMLTPQASAGLILVVIGLLVLEYPGARAGFGSAAFHKKALAVLASFAAVVVYALTAVGDRVVLAHYGVDPLHFLALAQVIAAVLFFILSLFLRKKRKLLTSSLLRQPVQVVAFSLFLTLSRLMHAHAVALASAALAGALKRTGALFTIVMARTYLHERGTAHKLLAGSIIVAGVVCIIL